MSDSEHLIELTIHGNPHRGFSRRRAMQWVLASIAAQALPSAARARGDDTTQPSPTTAATQPSPATAPAAQGYGSDPNLLKTYKPGDLWPLTLSTKQRSTAVALADVIFPKDDLGPAASELGVVDMLDEWISAPYPAQQADRAPIVAGLDWLDTESNSRFGNGFNQSDPNEQTAICDDICDGHSDKPELHDAVQFFARFRSICGAAYYSTPQGWQAIGYVGNVALEKFDGPPEEVLKILGVTQTVV